MKTIYEKGYQAILYRGKTFDLTPIAEIAKLDELVDACEQAKSTGRITHYIIRYVSARYDILTSIELGVI